MKVLGGILFALALVAGGLYVAIRRLGDERAENAEVKADADESKARARFWKRMAQRSKVSDMAAARERSRARRRRRMPEGAKGDRGDPDVPGAA